MRLHYLTFGVAILLGLGYQTQAQDRSPAVPIKAKLRQMSYEIQQDGTETLTYKEEGVFYRSSSGAELNKMGNLFNFIDSSGNSYRIVESRKLAVLEFRNTEPPYQRIKRMTQNVLGYEMVNGLHCAVRTLWVNGKPDGKEYIHLQYGLIVRFEFMEPNSTHQMVNELYNIEVAEPATALMRIPEGYSVADETEQ